ncbi:MAG: site-specific integrase, partial [Paracoccaceae bacterium]|nr:site-specific integrase [Paracoccaceae bacterium]
MANAGRWISAFLEAQAAELDAARNTLLAYGRDLKDFADWMGQRKLHFDAVQRADVEAYLVACEAEGLSRATRARRLSSIRQLYRFAYEEGWR